MRKGKSVPKIIQVPIDADLLREIEVAAGAMNESRAAYIRDACRLRLKAQKAEALDRQYVEGYRKKPEKPAWGRGAVKVLPLTWAAERW